MSPLEVPDGPQPDPPDAPEPPDPPPDGPEPPDPDEPEGEPEPQADPTTEELRLEQFRLQETERDRAAESEEEDEAVQHERRAAKASYLREKLEQRAEAERRAARRDEGG